MHYSFLLCPQDSSPVRSPTAARAAMTSPVQDFEPFEDEGALLGDSQMDLPEEEDGEELFGDNMEK